MPRRIIIIILILLIVVIIGGTGYFVMNKLGASNNTQITIETTPDAFLTSVAPIASPAEVTAPNTDDDNDGLTNAQETLWGTDPKNPDTDGDSYMDGQEVSNGHNPTIAAPNDTLPAGFAPDKGSGLPEAALQPDQYFQDNLDLSGGKENLSDKYKQANNEANRNADTLASFVSQQPIVNKLPQVKASALTIIQNSGPQSIAEYLKGVGSLSALTDRSLLSQALSDLYTSNDTNSLNSFLLQAQLYQDQLKALKVPTQAVETQRILLGYTQLFIATIQEIAKWNDDSVKAMVAVRQLNTNDQTYMPIILREIKNLQALTASQ